MEIFATKKNLGIPRAQMPQIRSDKVPDFIKWLKADGIDVSKKIIHADELNATQKEINNDKVSLLAKPECMHQLKKPVLISKDYYLMDGHHRWLALLTLDSNAEIPVVCIDLNISDLLNVANEYDDVERKDLAASIRKIAAEILLELY